MGRYLATGKLDADEIDYKLEIGRKLEAARTALLADDDGWFDLLKPALSGKGHPMDWRDADHLKKWLIAGPITRLEGEIHALAADVRDLRRTALDRRHGV